MRSVAIGSTAVDRLEARSGKKRRKKRDRSVPYPIESTRSGGGKKSKTKGSKFENVVAKMFEAYYGCKVRRTPGSGGWGTVGDFGPKGDLVFSDRRVPYHVECKKHEGWDLSDLITGLRGLTTTSTNSIEKWWKQTIRDCPRRRVPMLIFTRNKMTPLVMLRASGLEALHKLGLRKKGADLGNDTMITQLRITDDSGESDRVILTLSDLFKYIRPPRTSPRRKTWERGVG